VIAILGTLEWNIGWNRSDQIAAFNRARYRTLNLGC
jgi:hypothetical protein